MDEKELDRRADLAVSVMSDKNKIFKWEIVSSDDEHYCSLCKRTDATGDMLKMHLSAHMKSYYLFCPSCTELIMRKYAINKLSTYRDAFKTSIERLKRVRRMECENGQE